MGNILVVDDDAGIRDMLTEVLQDEGHTVFCASNGREALHHLRQSAKLPCLVLLDLNMPIMNGWHFLNERQGDPRISSIPVIVFTAGHQADQKPLAVEPDGYLPKPLDLDTLIETIEYHCFAGQRGAA